MRGSATREQQEALWDYGLNIGMAFQVVDDLLDFTGEQDTLGKPVGGGLRGGKGRRPVIRVEARVDDRARALYQRRVKSRLMSLHIGSVIILVLCRPLTLDYA